MDQYPSYFFLIFISLTMYNLIVLQQLVKHVIKIHLVKDFTYQFNNLKKSIIGAINLM